MENEQPPMDFRRLEMIADTEQEKAILLEFFFKTTDDILLEMKNALKNRAASDWKEAAHKLRGAAANMGMVPLEKLCLDSEKTTFGPPSDADVLFKSVENETLRVKAFIAEKAPFLLTSGI